MSSSWFTGAEIVVSAICLVVFVWSVWTLVRTPRQEMSIGAKVTWFVVFVLFTPFSQIVYSWWRRRRLERGAGKWV